VVAECLLERARDAVALAGGGADRHEIVVVQVDALRAELGELADGFGRFPWGAGRQAEGIGTDIPDGPETEGELVLGAWGKVRHAALLQGDNDDRPAGEARRYNASVRLERDRARRGGRRRSRPVRSM